MNRLSESLLAHLAHVPDPPRSEDSRIRFIRMLDQLQGTQTPQCLVALLTLRLNGFNSAAHRSTPASIGLGASCAPTSHLVQVELDA